MKLNVAGLNSKKCFGKDLTNLVLGEIWDFPWNF